MADALSSLSEPLWTTELARYLLHAGAAVARLDERISVSPAASAWALRASWTGLAQALLAQGEEIEEIDIFSAVCGVPIPGRRALATTQDPLDILRRWRTRFAANGRLHWTDALPFSFDPPEGWRDRASPLRALELQARWACADPSETAWLELPLLLQRLGITRMLLPDLVTGDRSLRQDIQDAPMVIKRFLRTLARAAEAGLDRLIAMERDRQHTAAAIAAEHRPGNLTALAALLMRMPMLSPRVVARHLDLTISGAGKLMDRAADLGLCHEVSGRQAWKLYLPPALSVHFGLSAARRGRPPSPTPPRQRSMDDILAAFDANMAKLVEDLDGLHDAQPLS